MACSETQSLLYSVYVGRHRVFVRKKKDRYLTREIVSYLQDLGERFHNPGILITIHLDHVDKRHLSLCAFAERFENSRKFLRAINNPEGSGMRLRPECGRVVINGREEYTNLNLLYDQSLVLIGTRTPFDGIYQTRPNALYEFLLG